MKQKVNALFHLLNILMAASLFIMAFLVFGNVVLRYFFNSGITWSEEMARFLFIWMVFLGAIGALKDNQHLGVDMLIKRLSPTMKKVFYVTSNVLVIYTLWLVFDGSWKMTAINQVNKAPATGLPLSYIFGIGIVMSVGMGIIVLYNLYRALFIKGEIEELTRMVESEEEVLESLHHENKDTRGGENKWH